jgi:hypothetical protein
LFDPTKSVDINEEDQIQKKMRNAATRSGQQPYEEKLSFTVKDIQKRLIKAATKQSLENANEQAATVIAQAAEMYIRNVIDELIKASKRRLDMNNIALPVRLVANPRKDIDEEARAQCK